MANFWNSFVAHRLRITGLDYFLEIITVQYSLLICRYNCIMMSQVTENVRPIVMS